MMKRRDFLKKLSIVCGAAVACPTELLKGKTEREILLEKFRAAFKATKFKPPVSGGRTGRYIIYDEFASPLKIPRKHYYITYHYETTKA